MLSRYAIVCLIPALLPTASAARDHDGIGDARQCGDSEDRTSKRASNLELR